MAYILLTVETAGLDRKLTALEESQLPFANILAGSRAAFHTMNTLRAGLPYFVDRPTGYSVTGIRYEKATRARPVASIYIDDDANKGTSRAGYLRPIIRGGERGPKPGERQLQRRGMLPRGWGYVPTPALPLDRYGNVPRGTMQKILSGIRGFGEEGYSANRTERSEKRRGKRDEYFVVPVNNKPARQAHLRPGVYVRSRAVATSLATRQASRVARPVLLFVPLPTYAQTFDFEALAKAEALRRYRQEFPAALRQAVKTARR